MYDAWCLKFYFSWWIYYGVFAWSAVIFSVARVVNGLTVMWNFLDFVLLALLLSSFWKHSPMKLRARVPLPLLVLLTKGWVLVLFIYLFLKSWRSSHCVDKEKNPYFLNCIYLSLRLGCVWIKKFENPDMYKMCLELFWMDTWMC